MNPNVTVKDVSPIQKDIEVTLTAADVAGAIEAAYKKVASQAKIKGFRPGKAPRSVIEQYYRSDVESDAVNALIRLSYPLAIQQSGLAPLVSPQVTITLFNAEQGMAYKASVEIAPQFDVQGYKGLELEKDATVPEEKEIEDSLKSLQERMAQLVPLAESRPARADDVLSINYQGFKDGKAISGFKGENFLVELGKKYLFPELEQALLGITLGEKRTAGVTLPETWNDPALAGQKIDYELELVEVKEKKVPELNDDFAKDMGAFTTLDEVKAKIREDLSVNKESQARAKLRRNILEKLVAKNDFLAPESLVGMESEDMFRRFGEHLKSQGVTVEQAGVTPESFREKNRDEAIFRVKGALIFDAIAKKEGQTVTSEEIDRHIEGMAVNAGEQPAAWKKYFRENDLLGRVAGSLLEEKTLDFVLSESKIKTKSS